MLPTKNLLEETAQCFTSARQNLIAGAKGLHQISKEKLWEGQYDSFSEYLQEIQVSDGMASKLISTYEYYVVESGFAAKKLEGIDHEKLYLALKLPGTPEKKLASAETLTRSELKQSIIDPDDECTHDETVKICKRCHKRVE